MTMTSQQYSWIRRLVCWPLIFCGATTVLSAQQQHSCNNTTVYGTKDAGDQIEGPVCVAVAVNALRYAAELGRTVTVSSGPSLSGGLTPPTQTSSASPANAPLKAFVVQSPDGLIDISRDFNSAWNTFYTQYDVGNKASQEMVAHAVTELKNVVLGSDNAFAAGGAGAVLTSARSQTLQDLVSTALTQRWTTADDIYIALRRLQTRIRSWSEVNPTPTDAEKATVGLLQADITAMLADVVPNETGGTAPSAFTQQVDIVASWKGLIDSLSPSSFTVSAYIGCGIVFNQNKQVAVRLLLTDRLPSFDGSALTQTDLKDPFVTVTCSAPFAISAGVEFSFLSTDTFGIVPSGSGATNQFGITDNESIIPMPIGMVHARVAETMNHKVGIYWSFGVSAHAQGAGTGGSSVEYLMGGSIAMFRTAFVTFGWQLGKVSALNGDYQVGEAVPTGVTAVPVISSTKSGFGLAITFSK